jgi:proteasome accessory factor B
MDKTERLLDLIALFLDAREPVSFAKLREAFPDEYGKGPLESSERKFERDKADLADLGIALDYQPPDDEGRDGYLLGRDDYYLPQIGFTPEEMAVLYAAGSAALSSGFPGRADLAHALRKIAFVSSEDPESVPPRLFVDHGRSPDALAEKLELLWKALLGRKRVRLRYRGAGRDKETVREVDPWGICLRRGVWVLVGHCHLRKDRRTFHVDRIVEATLNPARPRTPDYEVPEDFDVAVVAREQVWEHQFHAPVQVELLLAPELAPMAGRLFPHAQLAVDGKGVRVQVTATYLDALLRRVLPLGEDARVVAPRAAVARWRQMLEAIAQAHASPQRRR